MSAVFHPYSELKHTWRRRGRSLEFKVSDYLDESPPAVLESLAWHLVSRAMESKCPPWRAALYHTHVRSKEMWASKRDSYIGRARNLTVTPAGRTRNLRRVFDYVNGCYFGSAFDRPTLAWSNESPLRRLGFYFEPLDLLAANRVLDTPSVPRYVLEFVVYHELLHSAVAPAGGPHRRVHHTREFKERERAFSMWEDSERWLSNIVKAERIRRRREFVPQV